MEDLIATLGFLLSWKFLLVSTLIVLGSIFGYHYYRTRSVPKSLEKMGEAVDDLGDIVPDVPGRLDIHDILEIAADISKQAAAVIEKHEQAQAEDVILVQVKDAIQPYTAASGVQIPEEVLREKIREAIKQQD